MQPMHLNAIDLNLLRLFDAVYRTRSVSRAAEMLGLTQPAASQGLTRLRTLIQDPLFMRSGGGVQPTPKAQRLADPVRQALATLEQALGETAGFDPAQSTRSFHIHMSDIGESRFLPELMVALRERAPGVRIETRPVPREQISAALDAGRIDFAFGFLPMVRESERVELLK
ncbi:MAG: LysR family transcriptional regulator, partial [Comamonadaceae bacterium]